MATQGSPMMGALGGMGRLTELRQRLLFVAGALLVFRIGTFIPVPGVNPVALAALFEQAQGSILDMFNMFSGGALERASLFALGIMPYISASIIMQLMSAVIPSLEQLKKEGESGRRKITQYTRYGTVVLATFQAVGISIALQSQVVGGETIVIHQGVGFVVTAAVSLVTGTMFLMWLGEQITERGIGNGISMIIFAGIVAGLPSAIGGTLELARTGELNALTILFLFVLAIAVTAFVVFVERGQRRITINYAKRQQGRRMLAAQSTHLPLKLNMSGVIPPIFASSIILFPATLGQWFGNTEGTRWIQDIFAKLSPGEPVYVMAYAAAIIFFCFFYTALVFNSRETADNLKRSGAFIPGIRPGEQTAKYIDGVMSKLTFWGAIYITLVCLLPEFLIVGWNVPFYFGGTSLLIIVVVVMDFMAQVQAHLMSHQYEGLMKKANLKGSGAGLLR
ncbi:MAG: preprotein translocase subunit SecY [gamma proteobacterium symbiont of Ctena orbiculata]|uniref:Protein translocase subunit SecY n=1 Tax=Candidatus Thiodiazotropha taylori TaxID=2792791 RepID=A0A944MA11_9GAMM|nr:preprotein translocase subunit SecY [Candidatus Thiodiazotropha taylori]PUB86862.1 MAG: preprotein translocase subunit SecY [gamma proteobacterium symbiont of Ctena orbiculata]MBT2989830.1 preprotein translocase subunit SecY [Candidatus Thiodiazotropha taylori]MBT2995456.1 preprotein translocase subunit SecY [Candidatus Thiodiazotropha taylori]MBT3001540.1 preprotein translocase subunit SecY [Candidatus Thiodiazotropha taylori]